MDCEVTAAVKDRQCFFANLLGYSGDLRLCYDDRACSDEGFEVVGVDSQTELCRQFEETLKCSVLISLLELCFEGGSVERTVRVSRASQTLDQLVVSLQRSYCSLSC